MPVADCPADTGAETIRILLVEYPTLFRPAPDTVTDLASKVVLLDEPVVFPTAKPPIV